MLQSEALHDRRRDQGITDITELSVQQTRHKMKQEALLPQRAQRICHA